MTSPRNHDGSETVNLDKYEEYLSNLFSDQSLFMAGQELNSKLQTKFSDLTPAYARKIVQRAVINKVIKSSAPITFGKNQYVYFNNKSKLSKNTIKTISKIFRPPIYRLLSLIDIGDGITSYYEALKITASPLGDSKSKVNTLDELLMLLKEMNLVEVTDKFGIKYIIDADYQAELEKLILKHFSRMKIDALFVLDILIWLRKHNLIDNNMFLYRNKSTPSRGVKHNNLAWDAVSYTGTTGLGSGNYKESDIDKKTLVVLDVVVSRAYSEVDLDGFYSRIQIVLNSVKTGKRKVLPIVVFQEADKSVLTKMNGLGFFNINLGTIYGERIYETIDKLKLIKTEQISSKVNKEILVQNIEEVLSTFRDIGQETNLENIKGDLFEALLYPLIKALYPNAELNQNKELKENNEKYEYDFILRALAYSEYVIIEAKGYKSTKTIKLGDAKTKNTLMWFFRKTFPFAQKRLQKYSDPAYNFQFKGSYITTAKFEKSALDWIEQMKNSKIKPSQMDIAYDGVGLTKLLELKGLNHEKKIIEKYYL